MLRWRRIGMNHSMDEVYDDGLTEDDELEFDTWMLVCDRCDTQSIPSLIENLVHEDYLIDTPGRAAVALCPQCATDDDGRHFPGSWLLLWAIPE
jgi:hypothetical protein